MWVHIPHCWLACGQKCGRGSGFAKIVYDTFFVLTRLCCGYVELKFFDGTISQKQQQEKNGIILEPSIKKSKKETFGRGV